LWDPVYNWEQAAVFRLLPNMHRGREGRLTTFLAWVCSLSQGVTDEVVGLLLAGNDEALQAGKGVQPRAATEVFLPGGLKADLSFVWPEQALQLLVEVKLDAPFAEYKDSEGKVALQPDRYVSAWNENRAHEANIRLVGTLSHEGLVGTASGLNEAASATGEVRRANDIRWLDVRERIQHRLATGKIEPDARAAASELRNYLTAAFEDPDATGLGEAFQIVSAFAERLLTEEFGSARLDAPKIYTGSVCVQGNIRPVRVAGEELILWVAYTPVRSTYSPRDCPYDTLEIAFYSATRPSENAANRLLDAGFERYHDRASWVAYRALLQWAWVLDAADSVGYAVDWARKRLAGVHDVSA
jgi:hypothetical protein